MLTKALLLRLMFHTLLWSFHINNHFCGLCLPVIYSWSSCQTTSKLLLKRLITRHKYLCAFRVSKYSKCNRNHRGITIYNEVLDHRDGFCVCEFAPARPPLENLNPKSQVWVHFVFSLNNIYLYRPQRSCRKVMFSQASVILFTGGGVYPSMHLGRHPPGQTPSRQTPPGRQPPPPPSRQLLQQTVRILLECILVTTYVLSQIELSVSQRALSYSSMWSYFSSLFSHKMICSKAILI